MKRLCFVAILTSTAVLDAHAHAARTIEWRYDGGQHAHAHDSAALALTPATVAQRAPAPGRGPATTATRAQSPGAGTAPKDASGKDAFDRICAACHGPEARGDAGPRLVPFSASVEVLRAVVREGSGQMPPISARELSDDSVAMIHEYLTSLAR